MVAKILEIDRHGMVKLNVNLLTIPELKNLHDKVENHMEYFTHLYHLLDPESAYAEIEEIERPIMVNNSFPIDDTNAYFIIAKERLESLYDDPIKRAFVTFKKGFESTNRYVEAMAEEGNFSHGKDGNFAEIQRALKEMPDMMEKYDQVETKYKKKLSSMRGNKEEEMDKDIDYMEDDIAKAFNA